MKHNVASVMPRDVAIGAVLKSEDISELFASLVTSTGADEVFTVFECDMRGSIRAYAGN